MVRLLIISFLRVRIYPQSFIVMCKLRSFYVIFPVAENAGVQSTPERYMKGREVTDIRSVFPGRATAALCSFILWNQS